MTMRINHFDTDQLKPCGIEVQLRQLATTSEPMEAASWQKLLELVAHLQSDGSEFEIGSFLLSKELHLFKREPLDPILAMQMKRFAEQWRIQNPDQTTWGNRLSQEMRRRFPTKPGVDVSVQVDWRDYGPIHNGFPEMHYRFQIKRPESTITEDARAKEVVEAGRIISEAFGFRS
jgi:hypothetical protein